MRARPLLIALLVALAAVAVLAVATGSAGAAAKASGKAATVDVRKTKLGRILVDAQGRTLYDFVKDKNGKSACGGACAKFWPPLMTTGKPTAGKGVQAKLLGTTVRKAGRQVTDDGHPLYTYAGDNKPGQTNGQGSTNFGAAWWVLAPNGHQITKR
jgi:predicted lipoprotein with Yx(FWY)xxD motif